MNALSIPGYDYWATYREEYRDPTEEEARPVAESILKHLRSNPNEWLAALSEVTGRGMPSGLGETLRDGDEPEAGRIAIAAALAKFNEDAEELAASWLVDGLTNFDLKRLAEWRPVKFASLGRAYFLAEMLT